jgi:hypothetical protein
MKKFGNEMLPMIGGRGDLFFVIFTFRLVSCNMLFLL